MDLPPAWREPARAARISLIAESFARLLGRPLVEEGSIETLWEAPDVIVAHGTGSDPVFFFGNRAAVDLFETTPEAFTAMPSRLSAEEPLRAERAELLARVTRDGFVDDYSGVRISAKGRRFTVRNGIVWNLMDANGQVQGQAATFELPKP